MDELEPPPVSDERQASALDVATRGHRLHPLSLVFVVSRYLYTLVVSLFFLLVLGAGDRGELFLLFGLIPAAIYAVLHYISYRYLLTDEHIVVREGILFRKVRHVPYGRIQNVDTVQGPAHRVFGVVEVRLETAGGAEPEAVLKVVSMKRLEELRAGVFRGRGGFEPVADAEAEDGAPALGQTGYAEREPFYRMSQRELLLFGLVSQKGLVYLAGFLFLLREFDLFDNLEEKIESSNLNWEPSAWEIAGLVLVALVLLQAATIAWAILTLKGFRITRSGEDLRTTCGLLTHQTATLPRGRIQMLTIRESLLHRWMGRASVKALTAGGDSTSESQISRKWLVPIASKAALPDILREVEPDVDLCGAAWTPVHPNGIRRVFVRWLVLLTLPTVLLIRLVGLWGLVALPLLPAFAWLFAKLRMRWLGYSLSPDAVLLRDGWWLRRRVSVRFSKIQSVSLMRSPFDRRHSMATLRVDTAGNAWSTMEFAIPYLDLRVARTLMNRLRDEAARYEFRW